MTMRGLRLNPTIHQTPSSTAPDRRAVDAPCFVSTPNRLLGAIKPFFGVLLAAILAVACSGEGSNDGHLNGLANESSVYLLRHAQNPVNWQPWSEEAFETARETDRLVIVSSGYMACHWCHVMERESFSNDSIAAYMNAHFVCIKVDREERPDVDQVYIDAVEMISGRAGWPLNCITLPDGRPVYGGTYFAPEDWMNVLTRVNALYQSDRLRIESIADELSAGLNSRWSIDPNASASLPVDRLVEQRTAYFDTLNGGDLGSPKFILPGDLSFLLHHAVVRENAPVMQHLRFTLDRLPHTAVYDAVGGGFFRYTVDEAWELPHFEKMLYDNAQLIALYADAYRQTNAANYKIVIDETVDFVVRELMAPDGSFYSSLDADSNGEEGGYYSVSDSELNALRSEIATVDSILSVSALDSEGGNYAIRIHPSGDGRAWSTEDRDSAERVRNALKRIRQRREEPQKDTKILTSWNALMLQALCSAWRATGDDRYLDAARRASDAVLAGAFTDDNQLFHTRTKGTATVEGLLDDYGYMLEAQCDLYACTWDAKHLDAALRLANAIETRFASLNGIYAYRQDRRGVLPGTPPNVNDNVVPSANAAVANGFFMLGTLTAEPTWIRKARGMVEAVSGKLIETGGYHHWARLHLRLEQPFHAVVMTGIGHRDPAHKQFEGMYLPQAIVVGGTAPNNALLDGKPYTDTLIYVCKEGACRLPVKSIDDALVEMDYR